MKNHWLNQGQRVGIVVQCDEDGVWVAMAGACVTLEQCNGTWFVIDTEEE